MPFTIYTLECQVVLVNEQTNEEYVKPLIINYFLKREMAKIARNLHIEGQVSELQKEKQKLAANSPEQAKVYDQIIADVKANLLRYGNQQTELYSIIPILVQD